MSGVVAIVAAAGLSRRMAPANKLLERFGGGTVLAATLAAVAASRADAVIVVVGHDGGRVRAEVPAAMQVVFAAGYADGLSATLGAGLDAVGDTRGVLICLGDMPLVRTGTIDRLIEAFDRAEGTPVIAPCHGGRRGNPVLWHRAHLPALRALGGDEGGRGLLGGVDVRLVEVDDPGVLLDVDTAPALERARAVLAAGA